MELRHLRYMVAAAERGASGAPLKQWESTRPLLAAACATLRMRSAQHCLSAITGAFNSPMQATSFSSGHARPCGILVMQRWMPARTGVERLELSGSAYSLLLLPDSSLICCAASLRHIRPSDPTLSRADRLRTSTRYSGLNLTLRFSLANRARRAVMWHSFGRNAFMWQSPWVTSCRRWRLFRGRPYTSDTSSSAIPTPGPKSTTISSSTSLTSVVTRALRAIALGEII